jgi:hypothetical protein
VTRATDRVVAAGPPKRQSSAPQSASAHSQTEGLDPELHLVQIDSQPETRTQPPG